MPQEFSASIDERQRLSERTFFLIVAISAFLIGATAAWYYAIHDLTLSHYDARAHLVVARRVTDSLTPGWRQFGAVWLQLPHLLNVLPVMSDWAYRTGSVASAISVCALACGLGAMARCLRNQTNSVSAALAPVALSILNPNVLYLQSTPMTEALLFGLMMIALAHVDDWLRTPTVSNARRAGWWLAGLVWSRYEAWLCAAALIALATIIARARRVPVPSRLWLPASAALGFFFILSYASTGQWLVSADFFVPDSDLLHNAPVIVEKMRLGILSVTGALIAVAGLAGLLVLLVRLRRAPEFCLHLALFAPIALPFVAFYAGHPFRVRYLIPMVLAFAVLSGLAVAAVPRRLRAVVAFALVAVAIWLQPPFDSAAPMVVEAQWETPFRVERQRVTAALVEHSDGMPILASMGSLGHYMQETAKAGIPLKRFLHEGTGDLWIEAVKAPRLTVGWILAEQRAEGGDELARLARANPAFLDGFEKVIDAGGLVLYRRSPNVLGSLVR